MKGRLMNRRGVALVMALLVIVLSAGLLAAVTYYSLSGTEITGLQRKYQSSKEASLGGVEILTKEVIPRAVIGASLATITNSFVNTSIMPTGNVTLGVTDQCFASKLSQLRTAWACPLDPNPMDPTSQPDITIRLASRLGEQKDFRVRLKIVDARPGNTDLSGMAPAGTTGVRGLDAKGVVAQQGFSGGAGPGSGGGPESIPFLYTIITEGSSVYGASGERANLEVLYAY